MTTSQGVLLAISFTISMVSMTILSFHHNDIRELKHEIQWLKDEVHFLKMKMKRSDTDDQA